MKRIFIFAAFLTKHKVIRYLVSGGTATAVNLTILWTLKEVFGVWYLSAATVSYTFGIITSFVLQKFWTFQSGDISFPAAGQQFFLYLLVVFFNLGFNAFLLYLFVDVFGWWYIFSAILSSGLIAIGSFFIYRFIFRSVR
jgi:putative flippase GtrA